MKRRRSPTDERITLGERVVAALLTPLFFNAAVVTVVAFSSRRARIALFSLGSVYRSLGDGALLLLVAPAVVGFVAGSEGTAKLFGHAFWTHHEHERSIIATLLVWAAGFAAVVFVNGRL